MFGLGQPLRQLRRTTGVPPSAQITAPGACRVRSAAGAALELPTRYPSYVPRESSRETSIDLCLKFCVLLSE
jgi:hypothetical protein